MNQEDPAPKLHIDSDWKTEARAEKARLESVEEAKEKKGDRPEAGEMPKADMRALIGVLASQAIMGLGAVGDPKAGKVVVDLPGSQFCIDLLAVLEEKTKGNLSDEEAKELNQILAELRGRYVQISHLIAKQAAAGPGTAAGAAGGGQPLHPRGP